MQTSIAQAAALVIAGNAALQNRLRADFWPTATVFGFCKHVVFADLVDRVEGAPRALVADNPSAWIANVVRGECRGLRLRRFPRSDSRIKDRHSVGLSNGGPRYLLETVGTGTSDLWEAEWRAGDQHGPDRKSWEVVYWRISRPEPPLPYRLGVLSETRQQMEALLIEIEEFACRHDELRGFVAYFRRAAEVLHAPNPLASTYHSDLARDADILLEAQQFLAAVQLAWVFGGMGWWNDTSFRDPAVQAMYMDLSDRLFELLNRALCEAVNSSFKA